MFCYAAEFTQNCLLSMTAAHTVINRLWLFMNFFQHEMIVAAFFNLFEFQLQFVDIWNMHRIVFNQI